MLLKLMQRGKISAKFCIFLSKEQSLEWSFLRGGCQTPILKYNPSPQK